MASLRTRFLILVAVIWTGFFCIARIGADGESVGIVEKGGSGQREFDYFKLVLQWPGTYCRRSRRCCSKNGCCRGSNGPAGFTIHGLWADYNDGSWPSCCSGKKFDVNEISTLQNALNQYWPSLTCSSPSNCHGGKGLFWEHEWEKHGTCSSSVTGDEYSYFLTALNVYFKYNVTDVLRDAGYVPSNSEKYPLGGIISAIQNAFHATPELECSGGALQELYLCFYKDFTKVMQCYEKEKFLQPRDCAVHSNTESGVISSKKSCPRYVSLPEYDDSRVSESTLQSAI